MFVEQRYQLAAQILLLSLLPCCFAVEKFSMGNDKAWCVSYVILFCASLVSIDSWEARNHWSSGACRTMWGTGFLFQTFISEPCLFDLWWYQPYLLCFLTSEAPWKFLWGILSYSSQYFGCEKQLACYWWISWRNNMQGISFQSHLLPHFCQAIIIRVWCLFVGLATQFLDRRGISYCCKSTNDDNGITNSLEIYEKPRYFLFCWQIITLIPRNC